MKIVRRANLIYQTVKYLKPKQIFYQVWYRFVKLIPVYKEHGASEIKAERLSFLPFIPKPGSLDNKSFTFLNLSKYYQSVTAINWDDPAFGKLWTYNLNYFDFLLQQGIEVHTGKLFIEDFISKYPLLINAKESYTISLRGINWIKWISHNKIEDEGFLSLLNNSLYHQYQSLSNNLEYHLQGNHLLENAFSLLFGSFYFSDKILYKKANEILIRELDEQILPDGAHFELSPMYHQIILDRVLDCVTLLHNNSRFPNQEELFSLLDTKASVMLGWLQQMTFSNGDIPLVNDAANGIAPSTELLQTYAKKLGVCALKQPLRESGYRIFHGNKYELIVDYGIPGPAYIPGHAHADIFNFVLYLHGKSFIVDTGTSTYSAGEIRFNERSTAAHNTVQVNGREQSDTWGVFRMGRRAKPIISSDTPQTISGYHTGFKPSIHAREFSIKEKGFTIIDRISGPEHEAIAYLHFAPCTPIQILNNTIVSENCIVRISNAELISLDQYDSAAGFNVLKKAPIARIIFKGYLETEFEFQ